MGLSLADGRIKLSIMSTKPVDPLNPTLAELNAGIDAAMRILSSDFKLGPVASDTVDEKPVGAEGNVKVLTTSNYEGNMTPFRYFDATGKAETGTGGEIGDAVFQAMKVKGSRLWVAKRFTSKKSAAAWAADDEVEVYEVVTDNAADAEATGYIKKNVPISVEDAWLNGTVAAGA
ncbi:MAG: hypothetical protein HOW59_37015 [Nonomuraea sp.]|nr:hypothetical protein [Nonomuraea sp.]NUQ31332.1 hypothetical protein [Dermatophilaceae bacterium]NUR81042.1 hypothetical protein [Dermatophilaceae bacterium]